MAKDKKGAQKKPTEKTPRETKAPNPMVLGLVALGILLAFAVGFIVGSAAFKEKKDATQASARPDAPVKVVLADGTPIGDRLNKMEENMVQSLNSEASRVTQFTREVGRQKILDAVAAEATLTLDLSKADRFPSKGPKEALVTLVEFSDFMCPYCSKMAVIIDQIYERNPNNIRVVFVDTPLTSIHPYSPLIHQGGIEAHKQGKFWEYYSHVFINQKKLFPRGRPKDNADCVNILVEEAGKIGLDQEKMRQALEKGTHKAELDRTDAMVKSLGINSTPTVYANAYFKINDPNVALRMSQKGVALE